MTVIKAAAVQLSPVLYSREGTVDKVCRQILALGREQALALAVLTLTQLAHQLQLLVLGAFDHWMMCGRLCLLVSSFFSWNEKAGREDGPPGEVECGSQLGGCTLPG